MQTDIKHIFAEYLTAGKEFVSASVFGVEGHSPASEGSRMLVAGDGSVSGTAGGGAIEKDIIAKARELFKEKKSRVITYDLESGGPVESDVNTGMPCGGRVSIFLEYFGSPDSLYIFGCGHVGEALVKISSQLGFSISCIEDREEYARNIRDRYNVSAGGDFPEPDKTRNNYIVIVTYSHEKDYEILRKITTDKIRYEYLGIVASSGKWKKMKDRLIRESGEDMDFSNIYSPAGLDTGGRTPADIALSISAEINSVRNSIKNIINLRDKKKPE